MKCAIYTSKYGKLHITFQNDMCNYLIVESVSFVLLRDVSPINPKKTIEIINSRDVSV